MATDSLGTLTVDLIANTGGFERGMERAERTIKGQQKALSSLRAEFDPTLAAYDRLEKRQEQLNRIFKSGSGVIDKAEYENLSKAINEARSALDAGGSSLNKYGQTAKQAAWAMRGLPAQFTDIAVSLQAGQNPLTVFLQQGGQIKDQFGGVGAALKGTAGYIAGLVGPATLAGATVAALALTYYDAEKTQSEFDQALLAGNKTIGATTGQLIALSSQIGATVGDFSDAEDAVKALATAGDLSYSQVANLGEAAAAVAQYTGKSAADIATAFAGLGKNATEAAQKASEQYHLVTAEQYDLIKALDDQGDHQKALDVLGESLNKNAMARLKDYKESLTGVQQIWNSIAEAAASAYNFGRSKFMPQTNSELLTQTKSQLDFLQKFPRQEVSVPGERRTVTGQEGIQYLQQRLKLLDTQVKSEGDLAQAQADVNQAQQDYIRLSGTIDAALSNGSPEKRKAKALNDLKDEYLGLMKASAITGQSSPLLAGVEYNGQEFSGGSYAERVKQINDQFDKKSTAKPKAYQEDAGTKMLDNLRQQYASMQLQLDTGEKLGTQAQALAKWEEELAQIKSKKTLTADQQQLLASSDLITAQLKRNAGLEQELKLRQENLNVLAYQDSLNSKLQSQQQGYDMQLAGLGAGDKERQRIQEQLRLEQDYQNQRSRLTAQATLGEGNGGISQSQYEKELSALNDYHDKAISSQLSYFEQLDEAQSNWLNGASDAWNNYLDQANNISGQTKDIVSASFNGMNDALYSFVTTGKLSFHDLKATFAETVLRMAIQWGTAQVAMAALNAFTSTAAIPIVGPLAAPAAAASALGSAGSFMSIISSVAGMAHDGIDAVPETGTWLLQKGERVVTSQTSAKLDKTLDEVQSSGGSSAPIVNIIENPEKAGSVERRTENGKQVIDVVVADLLGDGRTSKAFAQAFGMKRRGV